MPTILTMKLLSVGWRAASRGLPAALCGALLLSCAVAPLSQQQLLVYHHDEQATSTQQLHLEEATDQYEMLNPALAGTTFDLEIELGDEPVERLYFIVSNPQTALAETPKITAYDDDDTERMIEPIAQKQVQSPSDEQQVASNLHTEIAEFNRQIDFATVERQLARANRSSGFLEPTISFAAGDAVTPPPEYGDQATLYTDRAGDESVEATVRCVRTSDSITLIVWVADDQWDERSPDNCSPLLLGNIPFAEPANPPRVHQTMINNLVPKFLKGITNDDIYNNAIGLFGAPWGDLSSANLKRRLRDEPKGIDIILNAEEFLIDAGHADRIDILLYDIPETRTLGFFFSKDNFLQEVYGGSNERLIFYLDAPTLANVNTAERMRWGNVWHIAFRGPQAIVSTLAHELQHMISFYQFTVLHSTRLDTWLGELLSLTFEDLVAYNAGTYGPRNVYDDVRHNIEGSGTNPGGRLANYICNNDISLTQWRGEIRNYAINYAFGAYLMRNFGIEDTQVGGHYFLENIYATKAQPISSIDRVVSAVRAVPKGEDETFASLLQQWAIAGLLSDSPQSTSNDHLTYYLDNWYGAIPFQLGSIELYAYKHTDSGPCKNIVGPAAWETTADLFYNFQNQQAPASNVLILPAGDISGTRRYKVTLSEGTQMSIVAKRTLPEWLQEEEEEEE